jgi:hypothetical protein
MKISILNGQVITGNDLSRKWAEVIELSQEDGNKLLAKTHYFDIETKELVELPVPEPTPIPEPTEEEIKESRIQEIEKLLIRKQAMEIVGETVGTIVDEIKEKADEVIELKDISKSEKTELKLSVMDKLQ